MNSVFDMIGPIMIGPSSSHTAGAARLGKMARIILGEEPVRAVIGLHGSFAQTYKGHGTDKALVAGLLGFAADDARIREALTIARENQLDISFSLVDLGGVHPNTAVLQLYGLSGRATRVVGASVGGGSIRITEIDGYHVDLSGEYHTLVSTHQDQPGVVALVAQALAVEGVNIAFMRLSRRQRGSQALMILEVDQAVPPEALAKIQEIPAVQMALQIPPLA